MKTPYAEMKQNDRIADELLDGKRQQGADPEQQRLTDLLERISVGEEIDVMAEKHRYPVWNRLERHIESRRRIRYWTRRLAIAASVLLIIGFSHILVYRLAGRSLPVEYVEMSTPYGVRSAIDLPDGSKVTLNGGSKIIYPVVFDRKERLVRLAGEAFFEVSKNAACPFIVDTDKLKVKVLGTSFNVESYPEDEQIKVTLEEGQVEVYSAVGNVLMVPGEQMVYRPEERVIDKQQVDAFVFSAWRDNQFYFRAEPLDRIVRQLTRHFNVKVEIATESLKKICFTGEFINSENIEDILSIITSDRRMNYKREKDTIIIY